MSYIAIILCPVKHGHLFGRMGLVMSQISQCIKPTPHNAPFRNRNVHACAHFCYKIVQCGIYAVHMCTFLFQNGASRYICWAYVHIFVPKWCIVGYETWCIAGFVQPVYDMSLGTITLVCFFPAKCATGWIVPFPLTNTVCGCTPPGCGGACDPNSGCGSCGAGFRVASLSPTFNYCEGKIKGNGRLRALGQKVIYSETCL